MPKVEHIKRSHGASEYVITLTEDEMREFAVALEDIANGIHPFVQHFVLPQIANSMALLDPNQFPTPFN